MKWLFPKVLAPVFAVGLAALVGCSSKDEAPATVKSFQGRGLKDTDKDKDIPGKRPEAKGKVPPP